MNKLFQKFGSEKRWVAWQYKEVSDGAGGMKLSKMPLGKSNDPTTWGTLDEISANGNEKVGIMFGLDKMFLGIDIDHCINKETKRVEHEERENILAMIKRADTYMELSPSGTGIHLYFALSAPLELKANKKAPYECYSSLRFFTVTGDVLGEEKEVRTITPDEAIEILSIGGYPWGKEKKESTPVPNTSVHITMDDKDIVSKMFSSKNGDKLRALYNGDLSNHNNDQSSADVALCSSLAFWTRKDAAQIERIWLTSPLGAREKTQSRVDYRMRTVQFAIDNCDTVYQLPRQKGKVTVAINEDEAEEIDFDFLHTFKGKDKIKTITLCTENIAIVLRKHPDFKGKYRLDEFKGIYEIQNADGEWVDFKDSDILVLQSQIARIFTEFQTVKKDMVYDAVLKVGEENKIDSAVDYLKSVTWDGEARLDKWLTHTYGVEENIYHAAVASNWMKGLVKRIMYPGCKFDYVLVLEGAQGTRKSSSLAVLGRNWHVETTMSPDSKDFFMQFSAKAIVEFSEGETLSRTEVKKLKAIITTQSDKFRPPYGRVSMDFPRRCVFAMTTNNDEYLKDETGNRRWLPVRTVFAMANLEWLEANRDQLFAEAYHRAINLKETNWEFPDIETALEQDKRRVSDPNEDRIVSWYERLTANERNRGVTVTQVYSGVFNGGMEIYKPITKYEEMNIANVLRDILKLERKQSSVSGVRKVRWYPKGLVESDYVPQEKVVTLDDFENNEAQI
jgi:hypothetical protein